MSDAVATTPVTASAVASPKKAPAAKKAVAAKKPSKPRAPPPAGDMVVAAIKTLAENKGSSLQAIKKFIAGHFKVVVKKQAIYIRKYLKSAVAKKTIVQTKGSGAAGSFKLAAKAEVEKKKVVKKPASEKKTEKPAAAKEPAAKKPAAAKPKTAKPVEFTKPKEAAASKATKPKKVAASKATKPKAAPKK